jgi:hypothetical protein
MLTGGEPEEEIEIEEPEVEEVPVEPVAVAATRSISLRLAQAIINNTK